MSENLIIKKKNDGKMTEINRKIKRVILMDLDFSFIIKKVSNPLFKS